MSVSTPGAARSVVRAVRLSPKLLEWYKARALATNTTPAYQMARALELFARQIKDSP